MVRPLLPLGCIEAASKVPERLHHPPVFEGKLLNPTKTKQVKKNPQSHEGLVQMSFNFHVEFLGTLDTPLSKPYLTSVVVGYNKEQIFRERPLVGM